MSPSMESDLPKPPATGMPDVSVLMPMRNADAFVAAAAASILSQSHKSLELLVIDDGSQDRSREIVRAIADPRVRIIDGACRGIGAAMNRGLQEARGGIVMRCDADDLYPPERIAWQVSWLREHGDYGAVCGQFATMDAAGRPLTEGLGGTEPRDITDELCWGTARTSLCTFAVRAECLRRTGGFREWFAIAEDMDLQFRLAEHCRVWFEPCQTYLYRLHDTSTMHSQCAGTVAFYPQTASLLAHQRRAGRPDDLERGEPPAPPRPGEGARNSAARHMQGMLLGQSWRELSANRRSRAIWLGLRACLCRPHNLAAWRSLAALCVKRTCAAR